MFLLHLIVTDDYAFLELPMEYPKIDTFKKESCTRILSGINSAF